MTDGKTNPPDVDAGADDNAMMAPKVGTALFGVAALMFGLAVVLADRTAKADGPNLVVMGLVATAGLALGLGAIAGFLALRQGVTGLARGLSIALCVAPALMGVGLSVRVWMQMNAAQDAAAAMPTKSRSSLAKKSRTVGPPARVALNPAADAATPVVANRPVARVLFDLDKAADRDAFRKGTWFVANLSVSKSGQPKAAAQPALLSAGHLFGPYADLADRLKTPLSASERAAIVGTATFSGAVGTATAGQPLHVEGVANSNAKADIAAFTFPNAAKIFPMDPAVVGAPLDIGNVPTAGAPVWLVVLDGDRPTLFKGVVAKRSPVMAVYLDKTPSTFDGVSGAPFVDKDGKAVAVFIGKSNTVDGAVAVGTPLAPINWSK